MDDTVAISLFRHGITVANKRRAYLGWTDSPLCTSAKKQICELPISYDQLYSSDLGRCLETAKMMFPNSKPIIKPMLREINFGKWEGKVYDELKDDLQYQRWLDEPCSIKPPDGESFVEFSIRVIQCWEMIVKGLLDSNVERAAIMTHGGVIRFLLMRFAPEVKGFWDWSPSHGKGYELVWSRDGLRRGERCILLQEVPIMANPNG